VRERERKREIERVSESAGHRHEMRDAYGVGSMARRALQGLCLTAVSIAARSWRFCLVSLGFDLDFAST